MTCETSAQETKWPDAVPSAHEDHFFSISSGNSWLHWSFHSGMDRGGQPVLFWRTPLMSSELIEAGDLVESLADHLPKVEPKLESNGSSYYPRDHIFGKDNLPSLEAALKEAELRKTKTSVYIVGDNNEQISMLSKLFSMIPSRVYRMKGDDFFKASEGRVDGMGLDRLAALSGAAHLHGFPALVFDSGTAATYTAADGNGHIIGGGISPGLSMRFQSLNKGTFDLPCIKIDDVLTEMQNRKNKKKPLSVFAKNTKDSIMAAALGELSNNARCVIRRWLEIVGPPKQTKVKQIKQGLENSMRSVLVTGGSASVIEALLKPDYADLFEVPTIGKEGSLKVMQVNNLIHFGVTQVLTRHIESKQDKQDKQGKKGKQDRTSKKRPRVDDKVDLSSKVGELVAKYFDDDLYVGRIKFIKSSKLLHVVYDDGDEEDFELHEYNNAKKLYEDEVSNKEENEMKCN